MQDYHQLDVWTRAMGYAVQIYRFTADLPSDERYNLTAQLRSAAISVPLNTAEGAGSSSNAEFARFLGYAYRSLKEIVTGLELCERLYPYPHTSAALSALIDEGEQISRMMRTLIQRLEQSRSTIKTQDS
jgi:four helix bundle protein